MIKTKKHIAIISLMFCLMASLTLAFGFGNAAKANAEGETTYKLSFLGETTNMIKEGWGDSSAIADGVLTVTLSSETHTAKYNMLAGATYKISFDYQKVAGDIGYASFHLFDGTWGTVTTWLAATEEQKTFEIEYTPNQACNDLIFQWVEGDKSVQFSNFTITEKLADVTVTAGAAIGNLPAVPEKAGYAGHWEVDGNAISSETVYNFGSDKNAVPAYEKIYTLSFLGEPTNITASVAGWSDGTKTDDGVKMTLAGSTNYCNTSILKFVAGNVYTISYEDRYVSGENGWAAYHLWEGDSWAKISTDITAVSEWTAHSFTYTPAATNSSTIWFQYRDGNKEVEFKNFTITETIEKRTFTKAGAIGELPAVPEKAGYIGHWEIDGETITAETNFAATEDKVAKVVYEKAYTLTFITNETTFDTLTSVADATVDGFVVNYSADWGYVKTNGATITNSKKYKLEIVAKKTSGDGQLFVLYDAGGSVDGVFHTLADDYATLTIEFTAEKGATGILLQSSKGNTVFDFESIVLTEFETRTLKADQKVGELPEIPCGANYTGKWYIGENEVTADTTIAQDEVATPVINYSGHIFKNSEFAFVEAKNTTKANENTATFAIKYVGTEEVESWTDKVWATGQFKTQAVTLNVKKSDGTEATIVSSQMQLNEGVLWFSFTSKVFGDIVEITIPAGEYKLTDGTGFKLEAITFYMVHYNCGVSEKTYYTVEYVAEIKETCTTDGCLDYYYCAKCGRYFEDEDCTAVIKSIEEWKADEDGGFIEKLGHDFETEWTTDATKHWHKCTRCDAKEDEAEHVDSDNDKECDECGVSLGGDEPDSSSSGSSDSSTDSASSGSSGSSTDGSSSGSADDNSTDDSTGGCFSGISAIPFVLVIMLFASACAIFLRKNKQSDK